MNECMSVCVDLWIQLCLVAEWEERVQYGAW